MRVPLLTSLQKLRQLTPSRRRQWFSHRITGALMRVRGRRLARCGAAVIVERPLFWTPEFIHIADNVMIWRGARIEGVDRFGDEQFQPAIRIGARVTIQQQCHITAAGELTIGDDSALLNGTMITDIDHSYEVPGINVMQQPIILRPTRIGRFCVIGSGARILAGTTLGDNCVVGANAVVRGVFPDHCVIAGAPARIVRRLDPVSGRWRKTDAEGRIS